jgi:Phage integrase family
MTSVHPLGGKELQALRRLQRETLEGARTVHVFVSERLAPLSVAGYQRRVARSGEAAGFPFLIHSHMLRHSCGYKLANDGHDTRTIQHYLGHGSIASTVRYTALAPDRFKGFEGLNGRLAARVGKLHDRPRMRVGLAWGVAGLKDPNRRHPRPAAPTFPGWGMAGPSLP